MDARRALDQTGHGATLFFALFTGLGPAGMYLGLLGMILCAALDREFWRWMTSHALFWIAILGGAYILLRSLLPTAYPVNESQFADMRDGMIVLTGIYGFVIGWWLLRRAGTRRLMLILFPIGMVLGLVFMTDSEQWQRLIDGKPFYGQMRGNAAGLYSATIIIGCLVLGIPYLRETRWPNTIRRTGWIALALLIGLCLTLLILSGARSVLLASAVCLITYGIGRICSREPAVPGGPERLDLRRATTLGAIILPVVVATGIFTASAFEGYEGNLGALLHGDMEQLERSSLGYRIAIVDVAIRNILDHPIIGLGFGTAPAAIEAADHSVLHLAHNHFHNLYLQVAAMTGGIGLGFLLATIAIVFRYGWQGTSSQSPAIRRLGRFTLYAGLLFLIASLFQVRFDDPPGLALISLLVGCALVCRNAHEREPKSPAAT